MSAFKAAGGRSFGPKASYVPQGHVVASDLPHGSRGTWQLRTSSKECGPQAMPVAPDPRVRKSGLYTWRSGTTPVGPECFLPH